MKRSKKKRPPAKKRRNYTSTIITLLFILVISLAGLFFFMMNSWQYRIENDQLQKMVLLLTPTPPPLLKDYMDDRIYQHPSDIPESTISAKIKIPIIMYHYVEYVKDQGDIVRKKLAVNPVEFEQEIIALKQANYDTYFVRDIPDIMSKRIKYSDKIVILTFDDGYEDFYTNVFPVLKKYNMRGTTYVISDFIGKKNFMNKAQIQEVLDSGLVEIGSHSVNHIPLKVTPDDLAQKEIVDSKHTLESMFNVKIKSFAYPSGSFNLRTLAMVKNAGYVDAVSTISGSDQAEDNLFYLNRLRPGMFIPVK